MILKWNSTSYQNYGWAIWPQIDVAINWIFYLDYDLWAIIFILLNSFAFQEEKWQVFVINMINC